MSDLVELKVGGILPDAKNPGSHILLLKIPSSKRYLPIWIGPAEASSIAMVLRHQKFERPLTHDLLQHVIHGLGAKVVRVVITTIQEDTFFARVFLERGEEIISIDARPSDCVALAVRVRCPIYCARTVLDGQQDHLIEIREQVQEVTIETMEPPNEGAAAKDSLEELMRRVERGEMYQEPEDKGDDSEEE